MRRVLSSLFAAVLMVALMAAPAIADDDCVAIDTPGSGQGAPAEPGDPANRLRTVATIDQGLLAGTTTAFFDITAATDESIAFAGELVFTTVDDEDDDDHHDEHDDDDEHEDDDGHEDEDDDRSTLTVALTGSLDVTSGVFEASGPVIGGTGEFEDATGTLTFRGVQDLADPAGSFTEQVTGEVCLD